MVIQTGSVSDVTSPAPPARIRAWRETDMSAYSALLAMILKWAKNASRLALSEPSNLAQDVLHATQLVCLVRGRQISAQPAARLARSTSCTRTSASKTHVHQEWEVSLACALIASSPALSALLVLKSVPLALKTMELLIFTGQHASPSVLLVSK